MQLTFPNGESANVSLEQGEITIGSQSSNRVCLPSSGLAPVHASFQVDRRGLWLKVPAGVSGVHVNARPVQSMALLRAGDLVCLGQVRAVVLGDEGADIVQTIPAASPQALTEQQRVAAARVVLRGVSGSHYGRSYTLSESRTLGRANGVDIQLDDAGIADRHAVVELHGERIVLRSLAAGATSRVNGFEVRDAMLAPGDQVVIDQHRFMLEAPGLPPRGHSGAARMQSSANTQTLQKVRVPTPVESASNESPASQARDPASLWWLIAAAAVLAAAVTAFVVYAPRLG